MSLVLLRTGDGLRCVGDPRSPRRGTARYSRHAGVSTGTLWQTFMQGEASLVGVLRADFSTAEQGRWPGDGERCRGGSALSSGKGTSDSSAPAPLGGVFALGGVRCVGVFLADSVPGAGASISPIMGPMSIDDWLR